MVDKKNKSAAIIIVTIAFFMLGLSFAAVPLYRVFCQKTGFGGTPQIVLSMQEVVTDRIIRVQFNADTNFDMPWEFTPLQKEVTVHAGELGLAYYKAKNISDVPIVGMATYNVTPQKAGKYFSKVACFCFIEQTLDPSEEMEMPVQFYIDPKIIDDPDLDDVTLITLSYTFFPLKKSTLKL